MVRGSSVLSLCSGAALQSAKVDLARVTLISRCRLGMRGKVGLV